jgi:hypothetical protein
MKANKIDKNIKNKFENRTFEPSASAWERLSMQLHEQPKQKKIGWLFYISGAASILLLVSIGIQVFSEDSKDFMPKDEVVVSPVDKTIINKNIDKFINEISPEKDIAKKDIVDKEVDLNKNSLVENNNNKGLKASKKSQKIKIAPEREAIVIAKVEERKNDDSAKEESTNKNTKALAQDINSSIKINSEDLLYAVTHAAEDVKKYYAKYNVNREGVLKTIHNQLKESNLKVDPNTILAEVERTIDEDVFQNNFMKSLKRRVTDIASAIASRND